MPSYAQEVCQHHVLRVKWSHDNGVYRAILLKEESSFREAFQLITASNQYILPSLEASTVLLASGYQYTLAVKPDL